MKSIFTVLIACACLSLFCFSTCSKKDDDPNKEKTLTRAILTGGNYNRFWTISKLERIYYGASGAIDSTSVYEYSNEYEYVQFSEANYATDNKPIFSINYPLDDYAPDFGFFTLSNNGKTLTLMCSGLFACDESKEGSWTISDYGTSGAYGSSFNMERDFSYPNGRKLKVKARIYTDTY